MGIEREPPPCQPPVVALLIPDHSAPAIVSSCRSLIPHTLQMLNRITQQLSRSNQTVLSLRRASSRAALPPEGNVAPKSTSPFADQTPHMPSKCETGDATPANWREAEVAQLKRVRDRAEKQKESPFPATDRRRTGRLSGDTTLPQCELREVVH